MRKILAKFVDKANTTITCLLRIGKYDKSKSKLMEVTFSGKQAAEETLRNPCKLKDDDTLGHTRVGKN